MSKGNSNSYFPLLLGLFTAIAYLIGLFNSDFTSNNATVNTNKINHLIDVIENNYVDSVSKSELIENSIAGMLSNLDPHSIYISKDKVAQANEGLQGHFGGVGIRFMILRDTLMISNVIDGGPSEKAGLSSGDRIIKVDGENIAGTGITNEDVFKLLKGNYGSTVDLSIYNSKRRTKQLISIVRGLIPLPSIDASFILEKNIGYIKLSSFSDKTSIEFHESLVNLKELGMQKLILDLRSNTGGYLHGAISVADEFLLEDELIVYTEGLHQKRENHFATNYGEFQNGNLVVLVNSGSASASEIVSGAIQDNDRGTIIGRRTFGKGLVQQPIKLSDNSELRLTISRYYTPTGRSIQKPYGVGEDYDNELINRYESGEMYSLDSSSFINEEKFITPKGKVVYGGGGVFPDIFVPLDSSDYSLYYSSLYYSTSFRNFCFDYYYNNSQLFNYNSIESYSSSCRISDEIYLEFLNYSQKNNTIEQPNIIEDITIQRIKNQLKNEFATYLFNQESRHYLSFPKDHDIQEAINWLDGLSMME